MAIGDFVFEGQCLNEKKNNEGNLPCNGDFIVSERCILNSDKVCTHFSCRSVSEKVVVTGEDGKEILILNHEDIMDL